MQEDTWESYRKDSRINQSRLKQILTSRWAFENNYQDSRDTDDDPKIYKDDALAYGHFVESLLPSGIIDREKFFIADSEFKFPSEKAVIAAIFYMEQLEEMLKDAENTPYEGPDDIKVAACIHADYYANNKREVQIKKFDEACTNYIDYVRKSWGKLVITERQSNLAQEHVRYIHAHPVLNARFVEEEGVEFIRKLRFFTDKWKLEIDQLRVDHNKKKITVQDCKSCPNSSRNFVSNFFRHRYDFQLAFYQWVITEYVKSKWPDYVMDPMVDFIVISNNSPHPPIWYTHEAERCGFYSYKYQGRTIPGVEQAINLLDTDQEYFTSVLTLEDIEP